MSTDHIKISVDLVEAAKGHLDFLKEVESLAHYFRQPHIISNALYRYENYWLPVLGKNTQRRPSSFLPPLDVHWVWHTHMLSPIHYNRDCTNLIGVVPGHCFITNASDINKARRKTIKMWSELFPEVPCNINFDEVQLDTMYPPTRLHISLLGTADQQLEFYYNVSLPHIRRTKFLEKAAKRYEMFLKLKWLKKNEFVFPMYDVDLMWHSHQLCPLEYMKDTTKALGEILDHHDFVTQPIPASQITSSLRNTQNMWHEMFHTHLDIPGTGYRGVSTRGKLHQLTSKDVSAFKPKGIKEMTLEVTFTPQADYQSISAGGKLELEATFITPLKYTHVKTDARLRLDLEKNSIGTNETFSWRLKWKSRGSNNLLHPMNPFSVSLSQQGPDGSPLTWSGFLNLLSAAPTILSDSRGEWGISAKTKTVELASRFTILQEGSFTTRSSNPSEDPVWDHIPVPLPGPEEFKYQLADHIIGPNPENTFCVRVVHCLDFKISLIKVYYNEELVVVSHTIGTEQLPSLKQTGKRTFNNLTLNKQHGERAMLIKNNDGDWAIVIASWIGLKNDSDNGVKESGHLVVHMFDIIEGTKQNLNVLYPIDKHTSKRRTLLEIGETCVSLKSDMLYSVASCKSLAEQLALTFSVCLLFTLCEPRSSDVPELERAASVTVRRPQGGSSSSIRAGRYSMIRASGYTADNPSNSYLWWQWYQQKEDIADLPECCRQHSIDIMHCPWLPEVPVDHIDPQWLEKIRTMVIEQSSHAQGHRYDVAPSVDRESDRETTDDESDRETMDNFSLNDPSVDDTDESTLADCNLYHATHL